jgi:hypothetical protein
MQKDQMLTLKIEKTLADRLAQHKEETLIPTSAFVRRAIEEKLEKESAK